VNYDTVTAAGAASLAGTLELTFINGYVPAAGDTLNVLTAAGVSGAFSAVRLAGVSGLVARQTVTGTGVLVTFRKG
jgi:hypothetical protein